MMNKLVTEIRIVNENGTIFDSEDRYEIPLYQRSYAWGELQLTQLIEDIYDIPDSSNYYIGSLIVSRQHTGASLHNTTYEIVDGQQRLTSLFLLLNYLGLITDKTLTFACRDKSNYTLENIQSLISDDRSKLDVDRIESTLYQGLRILDQIIRENNYDKSKIINNLKRVVIYRIEVPDNTDLNRYFEIMNTRGEQLEQHDILKASLMSFLNDEQDKAIFAMIWDACSDMTGYVQMHFISKNNEIRERLFGRAWDSLPSNDWQKYRMDWLAYDLNDQYRIDSIISPDFEVSDNDGNLDDDTRVRFESIIEFPFFLLHALKVFVSINSIHHEDPSATLIPELLDDKKLVDTFSLVWEHGANELGKLKDQKEVFSREFIMCLLRTRFVFDQYILKREFTNESLDGEWSIKRLAVSSKGNNKRPYYKNSLFKKAGEWDTTNDRRAKSNIMIQSALRVSYTSPRVMHWITYLLTWLLSNDCYNYTNEITAYDSAAESYAKQAVKESFFDICNGTYALGINTPHIVFNYLDFLLWKQFKDKRNIGDTLNFNNFVFEFRNSVEHWYPRNPSEGTFEKWDDGVDQFGNLCIIQRNINSKFSNMSPEAKKSTFRDMINKGSLKLRMMSELTKPLDNKPASYVWKESAYKKHEDLMIQLLKDACYTSPL